MAKEFSEGFYKSFYEYVTKCLKMDYLTPGFKAEVPTDTLLTEYVAEIVQNAINNEIEKEEEKVVLELVSKEFPIRTLIGDGPDFKVGESNKSARVDYLLADWDKNTLYFVELKTAKESIGSKQLIRMIYSAYCSNEDIIQFYKDVKKNSGDSKPKYDAYEASRNTQFTKLKQMEKPSVECVYLTMGDLFSKRSNRSVKKRSIDKKIYFTIKVDKENNKILLTVEEGEIKRSVSVRIIDFLADLQHATNANEQGKADAKKDKAIESKPSWDDMKKFFETVKPIEEDESGGDDAGKH